MGGAVQQDERPLSRCERRERRRGRGQRRERDLRAHDGRQPGVVPDAAEFDFRDVDAFDANTAYLLSIGEGDKSRIDKTADGGRHWSLQFKNTRPAAFFDAMAFWNRDHGIAMSDPVNGRFLLITTSDGGATCSFNLPSVRFTGSLLLSRAQPC